MNDETILVASQFAQKLDFFDGSTLRKVHTVTDLIAQPHEMAWDPTRRLVYCAHTYRAGGYNEGKPKGHELTVIDPDRFAIVDVIDISPFEAAHDVDYDPGTDLIYASVEANDAGNGLLVIDAERRRIVTNIPLQPPNAHWLALTPGGGKAYVTHKEGPLVSVVDLRDRRLTSVIPIPGGAEEVDCSADGRFAFVATPMMTLVVNVANGQLSKGEPPPGTPPPRLLKIDVATDKVVDAVEFDDYLSAVRVGPDGRVAVSQFTFRSAGDMTDDEPGRGRTQIVDSESMSLLATVEVGELPFTTRFSTDGRRAYVANVKSGSVSVIDLESFYVSATLDNNISSTFGGTHGLCVVPSRA